MSKRKLKSTNSIELPCYKCYRPGLYFKTKSIVPGSEDLVIWRCSYCKNTFTIPKRDKEKYLRKLSDLNWLSSKNYSKQYDLKSQAVLI